MAEIIIDIAITPSGRIRTETVQPDTGLKHYPLPEASAKRISEAFSRNNAAGLLCLSTDEAQTALPAAFAFWREFSSRFLTTLCHAPDADGKLRSVPPPGTSELELLVQTAPPMRGGEYLGTGILCTIWNELSTHVFAETIATEGGLPVWLRRNAPLWHRVGLVCFHLAENKRDEERPFAFLATYAPRISRHGGVQYQPLSNALEEYAGARNKPVLEKLLTPLRRASEKSALVRELTDSGEIFHPLAWTPAYAHRFLMETPLFEEAGLLVRVPDWWKARPHPSVRITVGDNGPVKFGTDAMLDFKIEAVLDGQPLSDTEWLRLMESASGLVRLKGQWVEFDREKLAQVMAHWKKAAAHEDGISFLQAMRLLSGAPLEMSDSAASAADRQWAYVSAGKPLAEILRRLRQPQGADFKAPDSALNAQLRPYQRAGVEWLRLVSGLGLGACLADDMGLGKTIQVLALLLLLKSEEEKKPGPKRRPSIIVLPASLTANWKSEIERFAPSLRAKFLHPSQIEANEIAAIAKSPAEALQDVDLVFTSYGMILRQPWLKDISWRLAIIDEAQAVKNPSSRQTKAVKELRADARIALTGTPIENRLSDLWSLFDFLCPGLLGSLKEFNNFVQVMRSNDDYGPLRNLSSPYILRRMKTDPLVISDLPDKTEVKAFCALTAKQAALYRQTVEELARHIDGLDGIKRRGAILAFILRFKQICNHPAQWLGDGNYTPEESGKFGRLREIAEEIASRQEKLLVFTQFREMTGPLSEFLTGIFGRPGVVLHGETQVGKRKTLVDAFQSEGGPPFFVLSLKAGGTGLNLTAASHVVHFDRWWNPAVENQATDRAFRIGQKRNVMVHKFVCQGTIEDKIDALISDKTALAKDILGTGAQSLLTEMKDDELLKFVALDMRKIAASGD